MLWLPSDMHAVYNGTSVIFYLVTVTNKLNKSGVKRYALSIPKGTSAKQLLEVYMKVEQCFADAKVRLYIQLKHRFHHMSLVYKIIGLILYAGHSGKQVNVQLVECLTLQQIIRFMTDCRNCKIKCPIK